MANGRDLCGIHCSGLNLDGSFALEPFDLSTKPLYLFVTRSAGLTTAAFFAINFLRHSRPVTRSARILVCANFTILCAVAYLLQTSSFQLIQLSPAPILIALTVFVFTQNQRESAKIFTNDW